MIRSSLSAAWTPASLPGLLAWYTLAPGYVYKDAGKTQPCANGDSIYVAADRSGNGYDCVQSSHQPTLVTNGAFPYVPVYGNFASGQYLTLPSGVVIPTNSMTVAFSGQQGTIQYGSVGVLYSDSTGNNLIYTNLNTNDWFHTGPGSFVPGLGFASDPEYWIYRSDGSKLYFDFLGEIAAINGAFSGNTGAGGQIGQWTGGGGYPFIGAMKQIIICSQVLSPANLALLETYLLNDFNYASMTKANLAIFDGDSLTQGFGASGISTNAPTVAAAALGSNWDVRFPAIGGALTQAMLIRFDTRIKPLLQASPATKKVVHLLAGTNDLLNSVAPSTTFSYINQYVTHALANGANKVVVATVPSGIAPADTNRGTLNALITGGAGTYGYTVTPIDGDPNIGTNNDYMSATYYNADGIHLKDAGYSIYGGLAATAILAA